MNKSDGTKVDSQMMEEIELNSRTNIAIQSDLAEQQKPRTSERPISIEAVDIEGENNVEIVNDSEQKFNFWKNPKRALKNFWNHPAGPMTIFFWAPAFKWALVIAGLSDLQRPAENLSILQTLALAATGIIWCRYSLVITPKNYSLFSVNLFIAASQCYQLYRCIRYQYFSEET